jgi:hypothetical protein
MIKVMLLKYDHLFAYELELTCSLFIKKDLILVILLAIYESL